MSEKGAYGTVAQPSVPHGERPKRRSHFLEHVLRVGLIAGVLWISLPLWLPNGNPRPDEAKPTKPWSWGDITPSKKLEWHSCYNDTNQCARLEVPMDWQDPGKEKVILAVVKYPAKNKTANVSPLFVNPGGPGGSGVSFLHRRGEKLQKIVGDDHDVISFDPRGVALSTPRIECFGTAQKNELWKLNDIESFNDQPGSIYKNFAQISAHASACEEYLNSTGILRHMSTAYAARDMLEILNQTGHKKLRYWGFSYGTILGGTFAGLFPDRVERLVSDANAAYSDWFSGEMMHFFDDQDKIWNDFDAGCHKLGKKDCALWASSPEAIKKRRHDILESLRTDPIIVPADATENGPAVPTLFTYSKLKMTLMAVMYSPFGIVRNFAQAYAALEDGDAVPMYKLSEAKSLKEASGDMCLIADTPAALPQDVGMNEAQTAVVVASDNGQSLQSVQEMKEYMQRAVKVSSEVGQDAVFLKGTGAGRKVSPKWRFSHKDIKKDTAFPILYIGNTADNVTPLRNAFSNSEFFPSSRVLTQNSYGHGSLSTPSVCTAKHVRAYFQYGTLPPKGTQCEPDYGLFDESPEPKAFTAFGAVASEEEELKAALLYLAREPVVKFIN